MLKKKLHENHLQKGWPNFKSHNIQKAILIGKETILSLAVKIDFMIFVIYMIYNHKSMNPKSQCFVFFTGQTQNMIHILIPVGSLFL